MRVDLHLHTRASPDSLTTPSQVLRWAQRRQLDALAITDHNTISMARELAHHSNIQIIVGEEIQTLQGEVIGLFMQERIPPGLDILAALRFIRAQKGLTLLPHPCDGSRGLAVADNQMDELMALVDLVEVLNARVINHAHNVKAADLAWRYGKPGTAGSDAHLGCEIGRAYLEMDAFAGREGFMRSMNTARIAGKRSSPLVHLGSRAAYLAGKVLQRDHNIKKR